MTDIEFATMPIKNVKVKSYSLGWNANNLFKGTRAFKK